MAGTLKIPHSNYFEKSPIHTPSRILKNLDLFNSNGIFLPKSPHSDVEHDKRRRVSKVLMKGNSRRASLISDSNFTHTLSDEFSYIQLSVNETRRTSIDSATFYPHALKSNNDVNNKFVVAKVINTGDEDEIEIIDLDEDEELITEREVKENFYPNCDVNVWLRSCEQEIIEPIEGNISGNIPEWLTGSLLRNGPGSIKVGNTSFNHLFDSSALLHRFNISSGKITYQCRFLKSEAYKKNLAANRIVLTEFGTASTVPDPCQSIFQRVASVFHPVDSISDNAMISIYPFNDEYFAFAENPVIHKVDVESLDTTGRVNLHEKYGIVNHTSHPHVMNDGTVFNVGMTINKSGLAYSVLCFPSGEHIFDNARIVAEIPSRWLLHPSYMHTFGITENFFIIVEQPLTISIPSVIKRQISNEPLISSLKWFPDKLTHIYLIDRDSGELKHTYCTEAFFFLHIINQYEKDNHVVLDICSYKDPEMLNCMYIESMKGMQHNPDYAKLFRGRPLRFVLPLNYPSKMQSITRFFAWNSENSEKLEENLVTLKGTEASAISLPDGTTFCKPEILCTLGCETPRIHYEKYLGVEYQYFYAISSDVDASNPGTIIKVDLVHKTQLTWCEENVYPSEPVFVPSPDPDAEDDGVIISSMVWGKGIENRVGLIVLDAKTLTEIGRCVFDNLPTPVPKDLHGWFAKA